MSRNKNIHDLPDDFFVEQADETIKERLNFAVNKRPYAAKLLFFVIAVFAIFSFRVFFVQGYNGFDYSRTAAKNAFIEKKIKANRGVIYDRNMEQLAFNNVSFNMVLDLSEAVDLDEAAKELLKVSQIADITEGDIENIINNSQESKNSRVVLKDNLPHEDIVSFYALGDFKYIKLERIVKRSYKDGELFSHIIGYTNKITLEEWENNKDLYDISDVVGRAGVEKSYERYLRSKPGKIVFQRDAKDNKIKEVIEQDPLSGDSIVLTIDKGLQDFAFSALEKQVHEKKADGGTVIVMNPKTGAVLSLVNYPSYDNNIFSSGSAQDVKKLFDDKLRPMFNRAISGIGFPIGSTIKPFIAAAALSEGIVDEFTKFDTSLGKISIQNPYNKEIVYEFHDWKPHGLVDLRKAIAVSSNIYFYIVGGGYEGINGLGVEKIKEWLEKFNFSKKTGIDLPAEGKGFIPYPEWKEKTLGESWYIGDTYNLSIGQGYFSATPIELITAYTAIANDGYMVQPRVVSKIISSNGEEEKIVKEFSPEIIRSNVADEYVFKVIKEGMRQGVEYGTSTLLNDLPVKVGAKTGTAQTGTKDVFHSWIVAFAPYDNPEVIVLVMLENVREKGLGPTITAKDVLMHYFSNNKDSNE